MTYQAMARLGNTLGLRHLASKKKDASLSRLKEFADLAAEKGVHKNMLDPHLLAGLIDGYTRVREFSAKELEVLPNTVLAAVRERATTDKKHAAEYRTAAKKLEKTLSATMR